MPQAAPDAQELELAEKLAEFYYDPLGFAVFNWDWSAPPLNKHGGLDDWQIEFLVRLGEECLKRDRMTAGLATEGEDPASRAVRMAAGTGHGPGKAQPRDLLIDTPTGRRRFGDLKPGDCVFGSNGEPICVMSIHPQGVKPVFRVTFDDRSSTRCCGEHLWTVHERRGVVRTISTEQMIAEGVARKNGGGGRVKKWHVPTVAAVQYPYQWTPVDPYTLGAWLGDGTVKTGCITSADPEVAERIRSAGYKVTDRKQHNCGKAKVWGVLELGAGLRSLGVFDKRAHEKSVPECYKHNIPQVRAEILRGLMDTDGYVTEWGCASFSSSSKALADDVAWLARSLGGKARRGHHATYYKNSLGEKVQGRLAHTLSLTMPDGFELFTIPRKAARSRPTSQTRYRERFIAKIEPAGSEDCMCITVNAPDSLYLTNDFIPTHNTFLVAIIIIWFISTRANPQIIVTASTKQQLENKTWRELGKMKRLALNGHWFEHTATKFMLKARPDLWYATAVPWSQSNSEAFAGTHEASVMVLFDESSGIDDIISEVAEGAMTTPGSVFLKFGNRTKNTGHFSECWKRFRHRWITFEVDSRTSKVADQKQIKEWIDDYGIDSDFVKVRVLGKEPYAAAQQFIPANLVDGAVERVIKIEHVPRNIPRLMGADCAAGGDAKSVLVRRQGPIMLPDINRWNIPDPLALGGYFAEQINLWKPDIFFIDAYGIGLGTYYYLIQRGYDCIVPVYWGDRTLTIEKLVYYNPRIECYDRLRTWLRSADIPNDRDLIEDLIALQYMRDIQFIMRLERKEDMAKRGLPSPDTSDALAMTFFHAVPEKTSAFHSEDELEPEVE